MPNPDPASDNDKSLQARPSEPGASHPSGLDGFWRRFLLRIRSARRADQAEDEGRASPQRAPVRGFGATPKQINHLLSQDGLDEHAAMANVARAYILHMRYERERALRWEKIRRSLLVLLMISAGAAAWWRALYATGHELAWPWAGVGQPLIGVVEIRGTIGAMGPASADTVIAALRRVSADEMVKEIMLYIDSPGGQPAEAERIADAVALLRERSDVRITAVGGNAMASAAYLIAVEADRIVVPSSSLVGSIGAVIPAWDATVLMERIGIEQRQFASGEMKGMLSPFQPHSPAAQAKALALVNEMHDLFADRIELRRADQLQVDRSVFATGEVWMGASAVRMGLADQVGSISTVAAEHPGLQLRSFGGTRQGGASQWIRTTLHALMQPI